MSMIAMKLETDVPLGGASSRSVRGEAARYLAASVAALTLDATLLWAGVVLGGLPPWLAGAFAYAAGLVLIYALSVRWVFRARTIRDRRGEFVLFAVLGLVGLLLNSATLFACTALGIALPIAKLLSAGIGFVANFVSRKVLLFSAGKP